MVSSHTATQVGVADANTAALTTLIDSVVITEAQYLSGSRIHLVPMDHGQVNVIKIIKD